MPHMKTATVSIRLDPDLETALDRACLRRHRTRSELVREAVRRELALDAFEEVRAALVPLAEATGVLTDEDVFRIVS